MKNIKGQVWIETVLYTIVGLSIISIILAFMIPKINETQDKILIDQSIAALKVLDQKIQEVGNQAGNVGQVEFEIKKGELLIDPNKNTITLNINNLDYLYSESGVPIKDGRVTVTSTEGQNKNSVELEITYSVDIRYNGLDGANDIKKLSAAPTPYFISVENVASGVANYIDIKGG